MKKIWKQYIHAKWKRPDTKATGFHLYKYPEQVSPEQASQKAYPCLHGLRKGGSDCLMGMRFPSGVMTEMMVDNTVKVFNVDKSYTLKWL